MRIDRRMVPPRPTPSEPSLFLRSQRLFAARARARRWAAARPALTVTLVLALLAGLGWVALGSGLADVRRIQVVGASSLSAAEIRRVTHGAVGQSMLTVDTYGVRKDVAAIPAVATVTVTRSWPTTLRVTVHERRPVLAAAHEKRWLLIDGAGIAYTSVRNRPVGVLPLTVAAPSSTDPSTRAALAVLAALPPVVRSRVTGLVVPSPAGVELRLTGNVTVMWGGPSDSVRKAKALAAVLHRGAKVYDVSTPGFVTTAG